MSLNLVLSYCNKRMLKHVLPYVNSLSFKFEAFLRLFTRSLDKPLQMTTLVNFAFPLEKHW
jgi:hypothetical protein